MLIGAHIYLWTERWSNADLPLYARARSLGLSALELSVGDDVPFDAPAIRRAADGEGMATILGPGGLWPVEADLSADDPAHRQLGLDWHRKQVDAAAASGALAYTGALYGKPGNLRRRRPPPDELPRTAEGLARLAEHAAAAGVLLALEPMSRFRHHLVNTPEDMNRLLDLTGRDELRILFDTYHAVTEVRDYTTAIHTCGRRLWGLHACENDRGAPGRGLIPWHAVISALRETPAAYLGLETYNTALGDFGYTRGIFHNLCPDGDAFVRQSLATLRGAGLDA
ncbi:MAG: sugar phosphate isomerase/epimerase [Puniceicoccaceae bacterium]|nr:MAG: sugar phosphate isomerase/epimerase [Puniceicoccaceae bacterium]